VYGALLVNFAKTSFSESFPELWLFAMGGLFIAVVMAFPNGLAGLYNTYAAPKVDAFFAKLFGKTPVSHSSPPTPLPSKPTNTKIESVTLPQGVVHEQ
jgi:urea transport system permease protein